MKSRKLVTILFLLVAGSLPARGGTESTVPPRKGDYYLGFRIAPGISAPGVGLGEGQSERGFGYGTGVRRDILNSERPAGRSEVQPPNALSPFRSGHDFLGVRALELRLRPWRRLWWYDLIEEKALVGKLALTKNDWRFRLGKIKSPYGCKGHGLQVGLDF